LASIYLCDESKSAKSQEHLLVVGHHLPTQPSRLVWEDGDAVATSLHQRADTHPTVLVRRQRRQAVSSTMICLEDRLNCISPQWGVPDLDLDGSTSYNVGRIELSYVVILLPNPRVSANRLSSSLCLVLHLFNGSQT
jgi:hypothetical protein